jgi:hypothetical protein
MIFSKVETAALEACTAIGCDPDCVMFPEIHGLKPHNTGEFAGQPAAGNHRALTPCLMSR